MDKCPFCGADDDSFAGHSYKFFKCDAMIDRETGKYTPSLKCKDRQIASLKERLEVWREGKNYFSWSPFKRIQWFNKLKDLGEI